jgi:hypothetical protein
MIKIGDYVSVLGEKLGVRLRGIIVAGPRIEYGHSQYRVMWDPTTTPKHWEPRPNGAWEAGSNIKVLSSLETRWV